MARSMKRRLGSAVAVAVVGLCTVGVAETNAAATIHCGGDGTLFHFEVSAPIASPVSLDRSIDEPLELCGEIRVRVTG
jgi:hypothetical protein